MKYRGTRLQPLSKPAKQAEISATCIKCGANKPADEFHKNNKNSIDKTCKACKTEISKKKWAEKKSAMFF